MDYKNQLSQMEGYLHTKRKDLETIYLHLRGITEGMEDTPNKEHLEEITDILEEMEGDFTALSWIDENSIKTYNHSNITWRKDNKYIKEIY